MSKQIASVPLRDIERLEIKVTNCRKTMAQVKTETDAAYILNGGMWNADGSPCPLLKVGGKNLSSFPWSAYGYSWDDVPDIHLSLQHTQRNFIAVTPLIKDGETIEKLSYAYAQGGKRGRSAMGLKDGALCLYCSGDGTADAKTPEQLREELYALGWESAVMLDGGGSSQCDFDGQTIKASRKVHNWICVYTTKEDKEDKPVKKTVCLDPGHGPDTTNGSPDGTYKEREFAWDLYERIVPLLEAQGVNVICTRTEDTKPSLTERATVANNAKADCFISLHTNASGSGWGSPSGLELYTSSGPETAQRNVLAAQLLNAFHAAGVSLWASTVKHEAYTVLTKTNMPAVLIEYGFHTNKSDVALLKDSVYRDQLAEATARGVCKWLGITYQEKEEAPVEKPWYTDAQKWAVEMGIADGTRPTDPCTRAEEWTMLQRLYNLIKEGK